MSEGMVGVLRRVRWEGFGAKCDPVGRTSWLGRSVVGFTLPELLAAIAIIAILIILLLPTLESIREKGNAAKCIANLKSLSSAILLNAGENDGKWVQIESKFGTWHQTLVNGGFLSSEGASFCPSLIVTPFNPYQTYGANWFCFALPPDDVGVLISEPNDGTSRTYSAVNLRKIQRPSKFLLMADSYTTRFKSQYHIVQGFKLDEIHLRHNNRANALFADGHVEALDAEGLSELGWTSAFDADGKPITF